MEVSELVLIALSFVLSLAASWALLMPFFTRGDLVLKAPDDMRLVDLRLRKDRVLQSLEDLELELRSKKISPEQYEATKAELTREAAGYLEQIDQVREEEERDLSGRE